MNDGPVQNSAKRQRPRPVISCLECRQRKLKCDRTLPCAQCKRSGREAVCAYQDGHIPDPRNATPDDEPAAKRACYGVSRPEAQQGETQAPYGQDEIPRQSAMGVIERLDERVRQLESILQVEIPTGLRQSNENRRQSVHATDGDGGNDGPRSPSISRHRFNATIFPEAATFMRKFGSDEAGERIGRVAQDLRNLHSSLKQYHRRANNPPTCFSLMNLIAILPQQDTCIRLSELYFDNLEHCFRILHRDTFLGQMNDFFSPEGGTSQDSTFVVQLLAVVCLGALMGVRNECVQVLRTQNGTIVDLTVSYMQDFLENMSSKQYYALPALQTKMLLLLLRWMRLDKNNDLWRASGDVLRHALILKMDKDPHDLKQSFSPLEIELRRRLWATIVEQDMMISILRNMPCLVPDYTTKPPLNINDADLSNGRTPLPRLEDQWTDSLCQCLLAKSAKERLHACRDLYSTQTLVYRHVLTHTRCFEKILETLPPPLRFSHHDDAANKAPSRLIARMEFDISIRRPLMQLYAPFAHANDENDDYSEARAGYLQSCLMLDVYQDLFDPKFSELGVERPEGYWDFFYNLYRIELNQAICGLCLELKRVSNSSLPDTPVPSSGLLKVHTYNRASLIHAVKDTLEPMIRRVGRFGSDLKELAYFTMVFNSVKTVQYNEENIIEALEELVAACRLQVQRDGIPMISASPRDIPTDLSSGWTPAPSNDVAWTNLANFPFEFDYGNELNAFS